MRRALEHLIPVALVVATALACYVVGMSRGVAHAEAAARATELQRSRALLSLTEQLNTARASVAERVVTQYIDRVQTVRGQTQTIVRKVPVYVPQATRPGACPPGSSLLPGGWRVLHDAAARGGGDAIPDTARSADAPAVEPAAALETVAENYGAAHQNAEQLSALQDWVRGQQQAQAAALAAQGATP